MPNFDTSSTKRQSVKQANNLLELIQHVYTSAKTAQTLLSLYQAGTDPAFNAAVNALFTTSERQELNAMATDLTTLITAWEANHAGALAG